MGREDVGVRWRPSVSDRYTDDEVKSLYSSGVWRDEVLTDIVDQWCERQPQRLFVSDGYGQLTYGELRGQAYRLATRLREMGVAPGDRLIVQTPHWREFV